MRFHEMKQITTSPKLGDDEDFAADAKKGRRIGSYLVGRGGFSAR